MNYNENKFGVILFSIAIFIIILDTVKIISLSMYVVLGFTLLFYSVPTVYTAMEKGNRMQLILSAFSFFTGLLLLLINWFDIINPLKVVFPSLLFIIGVVFLLLYMENTREKAFLYAGSTVAVLGLIIILLNKSLPLIYYADRIIVFISGYWHLLLIGAGIALIVNRKK